MKEEAGVEFGKEGKRTGEQRESGKEKDLELVWGLLKLVGGAGAMSCPRRRCVGFSLDCEAQ